MNRDLDGVLINNKNFWKLNYGSRVDHLTEENKKELGIKYFKLKIFARYEEIEFQYRMIGTVEGISDYLGVNKATFYKWVKNDEQLFQRISLAESNNDYSSVNHLYKNIEDRKISLRKQKVLSDGTIIDYIDEVFVRGDANLQKYIATSRFPDLFKSEKTINIEANQNVKMEHTQKAVEVFDKFFDTSGGSEIVEEKEDDIDD